MYRRKSSQPSGRTIAARRVHIATGCALFLLLMTGPCSFVLAEEAVPFQVSNPKHKHWSSEQAGKIYYSACELVARTVRPEMPPHLHPRFLLVLGAEANEVVRTDYAVEIHLKAWDATKFAEAIVLVAAREVLRADDLTKIVQQSVSSAQATISVSDLKENQ